jgi:hypothetical protein
MGKGGTGFREKPGGAVARRPARFGPDQSLATGMPTVMLLTSVLDSFDTVTFGVSTLGPTSAGPSSIAADSDITGILREVDIAITSGSGSASSGNLLGVLVYGNGALMRSTLTFQYTFPAFNLAGTGATAFSYILLNTELGKDTDYTLTIASADGSATRIGTLPVVAGLINITLASLTTVGTPFDDVTSILLEFRPQVAGTDMVIDAYGFDLPEVPESGTYAAIGFVGAIAGWSYRRRANKTA